MNQHLAFVLSRLLWSLTGFFLCYFMLASGEWEVWDGVRVQPPPDASAEPFWLVATLTLFGALVVDFRNWLTGRSAR